MILYGVASFVTAGVTAGLLIAIAILIVGPGEDLLEAWVRKTAETPEQGELRAAVVDRATSLAFLALLGLAVHLS